MSDDLLRSEVAKVQALLDDSSGADLQIVRNFVYSMDRSWRRSEVEEGHDACLTIAELLVGHTDGASLIDGKHFFQLIYRLKQASPRVATRFVRRVSERVIADLTYSATPSWNRETLMQMFSSIEHDCAFLRDEGQPQAGIDRDELIPRLEAAQVFQLGYAYVYVCARDVKNAGARLETCLAAGRKRAQLEVESWAEFDSLVEAAQLISRARFSGVMMPRSQGIDWLQIAIASVRSYDPTPDYWDRLSSAYHWLAELSYWPWSVWHDIDSLRATLKGRLAHPLLNEEKLIALLRSRERTFAGMFKSPSN